MVGWGEELFLDFDELVLIGIVVGIGFNDAVSF